MSDLQLSLIAVGAGAVAAVVAYNKWQEWKHRRLAERIFRAQHGEAVSKAEAPPAPSGERVEPGMSAGEREPGPGAAPSAQEPLGGVAQEAEGCGTLDASPSAAATVEPPRELMDTSIACVVRFETTESVGGARLWQAQRLALGKLTKPVFWVGLNDRIGAWEPVAANGAADYRRLRAGLQLADRQGPVTDAELILFLNGMQQLADEFLAVADMPLRGEALARAADLDRFCAGVDIQIGVNVVSKAVPFAGTKLRGLAEAAGLALDHDGMFHARDDDGATLFTLSNLEPASFTAEEMRVLVTHGVTFTLDVPRVLRGAAAFDRMMAAARQFAAALGGTLVDDNRAPLADSAVSLIRDKIVEMEGRMAAQGIPAGGLQARRLFS